MTSVDELTVTPTLLQPARAQRRALDAKNFSLRVVTGLSLAIGTLYLMYLNTTFFAIETIIFMVIGVLEACDLAEKKGLKPSRKLAVLGGIAVVAAAAWAPPYTWGHTLALTLVAVMTCTLFMPAATYSGAIATMFPILYVAWLFSFSIEVRRLPGVMSLGGISMEAGAAYLLLLIAAITLCDVGCFAVGKALGRTPLAPRISPGKTVEGAVGGLVVGTLCTIGFGVQLGLGVPHCALYGLVVGLFAQLGDLWESRLKREAGVKDSGNALAGHGGVLDRFDSFFFAAPIGYLLTLALFVH